MSTSLVESSADMGPFAGTAPSPLERPRTPVIHWLHLIFFGLWRGGRLTNQVDIAARPVPVLRDIQRRCLT